MREYKIVNSDLGYKIYRKDEDKVEWLDIKGRRNESKSWARLFYHRDDAIGALVIGKSKGNITEPEQQQDPEVGEPKQSWGELS